MSHFKYRAGISNVGSFQVSGVPYLTGSSIAKGVEHKITFPSVAKSTTVLNRGNGAGGGGPAIQVHFNSISGSAGTFGHLATDVAHPNVNTRTTAGSNHENGDAPQGGHFLDLGEGESATFDVKCKEIYISNDGLALGETTATAQYQLFAELTSVEISEMYNLTGSGLTT